MFPPPVAWVALLLFAFTFIQSIFGARIRLRPRSDGRLYSLPRSMGLVTSNRSHYHDMKLWNAK
jgi:hypothetical protein